MFILTADWHIGKKQYNDPRRKKVFYDAAINVVKMAIEKNIHIILNAGDLIDTIYPDEESMEVIVNIHEMLKDNHITMYCISGNHDFTENHWINILHQDNEFGIKSLDNKFIEVKTENRIYKIYGIKGTNKHDIIDALKTENAKNADIILMHSSCKQFINFTSNKDILDLTTDIDISNLKCKCILIGDTHITDKFLLGSAITVISPGSIEMWNAGENIQKFVWIYDGNEFFPEEIKCNYIRIKSEYIDSIEKLDSFLNNLITSNIISSEKFVTLYYYYNPDVPDVISRLKSLTGSNNNILICYKAKYKKSLMQDNKLLSINNANADKIHDACDLLSLDKFVEMELNNPLFMMGLSNDAKELFKKCVDKNKDPAVAISEYLQKN